MSRIVLVTGGARSGKSRHALVRASAYGNKAFVATAEAVDAEMAGRIAAHKKDRGKAFVTVEEPLEIAASVLNLPPRVEVAVVDCLTVWLANLVHHLGSGRDSYPQVEAFLGLLDKPPRDLIIVANEIGMGVVPESALGREFRDLAGRVNQEVARRADEVVFMVSGIPMTVKS